MRAPADFFGAFADCAILLPLLLLLSHTPGYRLDVLLFTSGIVYLAAGFLFRLPMAVQPLKSVAIAAVAAGASAAEIRLSGAGIGLVFLILFSFNPKKLPIPITVVRAVQFALGILLLRQAGKYLHLNFAGGVIPLALALILLKFNSKTRIPLLGIFSFGVFTFALLQGSTGFIHAPIATMHPVRWWLVMSLVLPQLALTASNSVEGAVLAVRSYFPEHDREELREKSLRRRFLLSIGAGNLLMALVHGLPFCHGAGGITAHVKAGAKTMRMNWIFGSLLIALSIFCYFRSPNLELPHAALVAILSVVGIFHLKLADALFQKKSGRAILFASGILTLLTSNLLYALAAAWALHLWMNPKTELLHD